jgi:hypothetical protein
VTFKQSLPGHWWRIVSSDVGFRLRETGGQQSHLARTSAEISGTTDVSELRRNTRFRLRKRTSSAVASNRQGATSDLLSVLRTSGSACVVTERSRSGSRGSQWSCDTAPNLLIPMSSLLMPNRTQLVLICRALEQCLREASFVFFDIQFDEAAQTLRIDLKSSAGRGAASLIRADPATRKTIDARLLLDVSRGLHKTWSERPGIQLRAAQAAEV